MRLPHPPHDTIGRVRLALAVSGRGSHVEHTGTARRLRMRTLQRTQRV
jgi:hypothetical protein